MKSEFNSAVLEPFPLKEKKKLKIETKNNAVHTTANCSEHPLLVSNNILTSIYYPICAFLAILNLNILFSLFSNLPFLIFHILLNLACVYV